MAKGSRGGGTFSLSTFLPSARRRAFTDGLFGGDRKWLIVGGLAWGLRAFQWARSKDEQVVYATTLQPGETLVLARQAPKAKGRKAKRS
jgi:hypothetical protein